MNENDPMLLNEIRSLKYGIIISACLLAFIISISTIHDGGTIGAFISAIVGISVALNAFRTKYMRK